MLDALRPSALLLLAAPTLAQAPDGGDGPGPIYPLHGVHDREIEATADMDGDGLADLIVHKWQESVGVCLSRGDTTFEPPLDVPVDGNPLGLVPTDVDLDGDLDLVMVLEDLPLGKGGLRTIRNDGGGALTAAWTVVLETTVEACDFADMDLDGRVDVVTYGGASSGIDVAVFLSHGTPFALHSVATGTHGDDLAAVDLDDDGDPDVVGSRADFAGGNAVDVFANVGGGALAAPVVQTVGQHTWIEPGDFDEDGREDVALTSFAFGTDGSFTVRFNDASGLLGPAGPTVECGGTPRVLDVDGDGHLDVISGASPLGVLRQFGLGDGTFEPAELLFVPIDHTHVAVGDVNGDGLLDWAQGLETVATIVLPAIAPRELELGLRTQLSGADGVVAADLDGDGHVDLADLRAANGRVFARAGLGDGTFAPPVVTTLGVGGHLMLAVDVDGDADVDLVGTTEGPAAELFVALNGGAGAFPSVVATPVGGGLRSAAPGDFDGDGALDLALLRGLASDVAIHLGAGDGSFTAAGTVGAVGIGQPDSDVIAADFDADGELDLAYDSAPGTWVAFGAGDGTFGAPVPIELTDQDNHKRLVAADLTADGFPDVVHTAEVLPNVGGVFQPEIGLDTALGADLLALDADGDGRIDLAAGSLGVSLGTATVLIGGPGVVRGRGDGTFAAPLALAPIVTAEPSKPDLARLLAADVDGDLRPDLVVIETSQAPTADAWVLLNAKQGPQVGSVGGVYAAQPGVAVLTGSGLDGSASVLVDGVPALVVEQGPGLLGVAVDPHAPGAFDVTVETSLGTTELAGALSRWPVLAAGAATAGAPMDVAIDNHGPGIFALAFSFATLPAPIGLGPAIWHGVELAAPILLASGSIDAGTGAAELALPIPPGAVGATFALQAFAQQAGAGVLPELSFTNAVERTVAP